MATDVSNSSATTKGSLSESGPMKVVAASQEAVSRTWPSRVIRLAAYACVCGLLLYAGSQLTQWWSDKPSPGVMPGEFEQQDTILFAWPPTLTEPQYDSLTKIMAACAENVRVVVLIPNNAFRLHAWQRLDELGVSRESIQFLTLDVEFPWARDYGPLIVKSFDGEYHAIDPVFDPARPVCEQVPNDMATRYSLCHEPIEMVLPGGNLLSNGAGLYVSTERLLVENREVFDLDRSDVDRLLENHLGAEEVIYLTPLHGEFTGHVDMFATFTAPDTIVIGQYDEDVDSINARILDENAKRLEGLPTACGPLQVKRIPMPPRTEGDWWTYTNVVFANGVFVMPTYEGVDAEIEQRALEVYEEALRGWEIKTVESSALMTNGGGPRCATVNIYRTPAE